MTVTHKIFIKTCRRRCLPHRSLTSAPSRPRRRPRAAPTLLPVRATNPLRPWFTLSPYLIPLNPQLPPWLLTEHDRLWTALVINNSPALRSASPAAAAGHRTFSLVRACSHAVFSLLAFCLLKFGCSRSHAGIRTFPAPCYCVQPRVPGWRCPPSPAMVQLWCLSAVATSALPHGDFCFRRRPLRNFPWTLRSRWRRNSTISYRQSRSMHRGKSSSPQQEQQLIWWARKQRVQATYCQDSARLCSVTQAQTVTVSAAQSAATRWTSRLPGQTGERAARTDSRAQPRYRRFYMEIPRAERDQKHLAWRSREADRLDYTALSSFTFTEKSWLQMTKKMFTGHQAVY